MGTNSRFRGEITIDPPLNWAQIRKVQEILDKQNRRYEVTLSIDSSVTETDLGEVITKTCALIEPYTDQPYRGYHVKEALQEIIAAFPKMHFSGYFDCVLEDGSEVWRIAVGKDRKVHRLVPKYIWPEV